MFLCNYLLYVLLDENIIGIKKLLIEKAISYLIGLMRDLKEAATEGTG